MKAALWMLSLLALGTQNVWAQLAPDVVVTRGTAKLTLQDVDARMAKVPADKRAGFFHDPDRITKALDGLILARQLADDARSAGLMEDPLIAEQVRQAGEQRLAQLRLQAFLRQLETPDLTAAAEEYYWVNREQFKRPERVDLEHFLLLTENHGREGAKAKANELREKYLANPGNFLEFARAHTEEVTSKRKLGTFYGLEASQKSSGFVESAFALKPGEISEPVLSRFGAHVLRQVARHPAEYRPFDDVKSEILNKLKSKFYADKRAEFLRTFTAATTTPNDPVMLSLRTRYHPNGEGQKLLSRYELDLGPSPMDLPPGYGGDQQATQEMSPLDAADGDSKEFELDR